MWCVWWCDLERSGMGEGGLFMMRRADVWLALRVAALGFIINCKPSEPYLALYLNETKHFSNSELATEVYPWSLAGTFVFLLPFGIAAEIVGCRAVILFGLVCREATRILLIFGTTVGQMALMQVVYGAGGAANAIYFAYVYTVAPSPDHYALLTSAVLAGYHAGNMLGALLGQALVVWIVPAWRADVTPLFYISWATCTVGLVAFALLPTPARALPRSLAHSLWHAGARSTCSSVLALWSSHTALLWLLWWLLSASGNLIVLNYFQLQLLAVSEDAPFGLLEALVEAGLVVGALGAWPLQRLATRHPIILVVVTSLLRSIALGGAVVGASCGSVWLPFLLNVCASLVFGVQDAAGRSLLAAATESPEKMPLLLSANTLVANGVAAALSSAAGAGWSANDYFVAAAAMQAALAVAAPCFRQRGGGRAPVVSVAGVVADVVDDVPHERLR